MHRFILGLILAVALQIPSVQAATFRQGIANSESSNWDLICDDAGACGGSIAVTNTESETRLATLQVLVERDSATQGIALIVPLGLSLDAGVRLVVGDAIQDAKPAVCFPDGCRVVIPLEVQEFRDLMLGNAAMQIQYFAYNGDRPIAFNIDMVGFRPALASAVPVRADLLAQ